METNRKLGLAIAAILGSQAAGFAQAAATADTGTESDAIQEITVTAQRRTESAQNVPITIQALTGEALAQLNIQTIDEFIRYVPNINSASFGPGLGDLSIRGVSTGSLGIAGTGTTGPFPNVAVYLDDQSGQLPSRNLDVYAADIERIEVLEGPQGTLFGGGAEAGVVRYITNKPKLDVTEGSVTAGYGTTSHGDPNSNIVAVLNLPLIAGTLAVRGVIYDDSRGGYINNVPSTFTRSNSDFGIGYAGGTVPANSVVINNGPVVGDAINPVVYQGLRLSVLAKFNEDWNLLIAESFQHMDAKGVFYQMPYGSAGQALPPLSVTTFNPSDDTDKYENTAWTLNGRVGALKMVYTGSYLDRSLDQTADYTNYARGHYADYYQCVPAGSSATGQAFCGSPSSSWREQLQNTHMSHELRFSTPDDWRLRAVGGAFYEQLNVYDQTDWMYRTLPGCTATNNVDCITDIAPPPGATSNNPNIRNDNTSFFDDVRRGYRQTALFGSVDYEILPKTLTLTAGTRYYDYKNSERGSDVSAFSGCFEAGPPPCAPGGKPIGANIDAEHLSSTASGFSSRVNLSWKVDSDALLYVTWSQGYRPGAFNRTSTLGKLGGEYNTPISYPSDKLINKEIGWKTEWADHSVQINGALYQEDWSNAQTAVFDPGVLGNLTFNANGPNYRVRGLEQALVWRVTHGLTFQGSAAWNSSSQTNTPYLLVNAGCTATSSPPCGVPILLNGAGAVVASGGTPVNIYGNQGSPLAMSPPLMFNGRIRYEWDAGDYQAFWQIGGTHQAHELSVNANTPSIAPGGNAGSVAAAYDIPGFSTYDASIGFAKDAWNVQFFGQNITNALGKVFISNALAIETQTVIRPRVLGIKVGYKF
jgi:outer membrane receptor protein involved in Fe transport